MQTCLLTWFVYSGIEVGVSPQYGIAGWLSACAEGSSRSPDLLPTLRGLPSNKGSTLEAHKYTGVFSVSGTKVSV